MAKIAIKKASTDVTLYVFIQDSSKTTGEGLTGLTFETASLVASYVRPLAARAALSLATLAAVDSAHSDGGFKEIDATNMPGVYRLDLPDAVCATGVPSVVVMLKGAANMAPLLLEIQLTDFDLNTAAITAAGVADAVWDEATADHTTGTTFGALDVNVDAILADTGTDGVKVSAGTGAGQLDFTSGVVKVNLVQILGTALTETAGQIAAGFKKFFDVATPTGTVNSLPDAVPGANGGLPTQNGTKLNQTVDLTAGQSIAANGGTVATVTTLTNAPTDMAKESTLTAMKGASWTNESLKAIKDAVDAVSTGSGASVADIMNALLASYTVSGSVGESLGRLDNIQAKTDLITTGTSLTIASAVSGSTITAHRGDTLSAALENIGALTNNSKLWFTVKRDFDDADSAAVVQIEKTGGLLFINGAAGTTGNGSLTINDVASGDVTIVLNASETAKLSPGNYQYDIQILRSAGTPVSTLTYGEFVVAADVTKATA